MITYNILFVNKKIGEMMRVYGVEYEVTEDCVDKYRVQAMPGEGAIIPLLLDRINGFYDYLVRNRCIRKEKVEMIYIFSGVSCGETLCIKYIGGNSSVIQDIGDVSFCKKYIA